MMTKLHERRLSALGLALATICGLGFGATNVHAQVRTNADGGSFDHIAALSHASEVVVEATVVETHSTATGPGGLPGIHTQVTLRVARVLKGSVPERFVIWTHGGTLGSRRRVVVGQAEFRRGEHVVVFLRRVGQAWFPTGMSRGKWEIGPGGLAVCGSTAIDTDRLVAAVSQAERVR
jgi:hypothetical protein